LRYPTCGPYPDRWSDKTTRDPCQSVEGREMFRAMRNGAFWKGSNTQDGMAETSRLWRLWRAKVSQWCWAFRMSKTVFITALLIKAWD
jgi:hypothetical protein